MLLRHGVDLGSPGLRVALDHALPDAGSLADVGATAAVSLALAPAEPANGTTLRPGRHAA